MSNSRRTFSVCLALLVLWSGVATAGTIYVDDDALPGGNGQTWGTASGPSTAALRYMGTLSWSVMTG